MQARNQYKIKLFSQIHESMKICELTMTRELSLFTLFGHEAFFDT